MCVKFPPRDLNFDPYSSHFTSTYTYGMTITPKMCGDTKILKLKKEQAISNQTNFLTLLPLMEEKRSKAQKFAKSVPKI